MRALRIALLIVFAGGLLVFCLQNLSSVTVTYLGWSMEVPIPFLILVAYLLGMASGWWVLSVARRSLQIATQKKE